MQKIRCYTTYLGSLFFNAVITSSISLEWAVGSESDGMIIKKGERNVERNRDKICQWIFIEIYKRCRTTKTKI